MLARGGKTVTYSADAEEVFGLELRQGDVIQTAPSTFLEIAIHGVSASVQVAENTSFKCDSGKDETQVTGELYYGRVRAKVAKLAGSSSFRITTPTLVAGVRGTDFGCDVIAVRGGTAAASGQQTAETAGAAGSSTTPTVNRVFCFEGNVAVSPSADIVEAAKAAGKTAAEPVLISKNEMVEKVVTDGAAPLMVEPLKKEAIPGDVNEFWKARPFAEVPAAAASKAAVSAGTASFDHIWPSGREEKPSVRNLKIPAIAAATLVIVGTACCAGIASYSANADSGSAVTDPVFSAGFVMAGSGTVLALLSSLFD